MVQDGSPASRTGADGGFTTLNPEFYVVETHPSCGFLFRDGGVDRQHRNLPY